MRFHDSKALVKLLGAVLFAHEVLELGELARRDINHLLFADVASNTGVLSFVVDGCFSRHRWLLSTLVSRKLIKVL